MATALKVLFVEDSVVDTELLCTELRNGDYDVDFCRVCTEPDYLDALSEDWDLIISDFSMPQFDGLVAFDLYKKNGRDIPFIFVSGAMGEERAVRAMKAGARDYVLKGELGRLNAAVERELAEAASRKSRRLAEAEKERDQRRLAVALQATGAGVFEYCMPANGRGYYDRRLSRIFGLEPEQLPGFDRLYEWFLEQVHPDDLEDVEARHREFVDGKVETLAVECRVRHADGKWRDVTWRADATSRDDQGRATDIVGVLLDRTEEKRLQEEFRQAQKMEAIGRLAGGIAHDFNNLLTVIFSFGEFVLDSLDEASSAHGDMQQVLQAAGRAEKLTSQLLAYSRRRPVAPTVLNVNDQVNAVEAMIRRLLGESIDVCITLDPEIWPARIDAGGLEQVLVNLAVNARDAMSSGGRLMIETSNSEIHEPFRTVNGTDLQPGHYVTIAITDNGAGMDAETQARLFEPFFTTKAPGKGTGLGLATCYGIVNQAGGMIWFYSEQGQGTTFKLLLPSTAEPVVVNDDVSPSGSLGGTETLLLVEDDDAVREIAVRQLSSLGYQVLPASSGGNALEVARDHGGLIHALVTDVVMPGIQGPDLSRRLREICPTLKTIYMSGYTRGAIDMDETIVLVQKPFLRNDLAAKVREALDSNT